jgi:hypothetical protein
MPTILRRSGPAIMRNGVAVEPRAMIHICEGCGAEGAPFIFWDGKAMLSWCAIDENRDGYCAKAGPAVPVAPTIVAEDYSKPIPATVEINEPTLF